MRATGTVFLVFILILAQAQDNNPLMRRVKTVENLPEKLLSTRTAVFYSYTFTDTELQNIQTSFQRSGIDAVIYFDIDLVASGRDVSVALSSYLTRREITNMVLLQKDNSGYSCLITTYNGNSNLVDSNQECWRVQDKILSEVLVKIYRASGSLQKFNFLINDVPEKETRVNAIFGRRGEFYAFDLKVDQLAVPKTGDEAKDKALENVFAGYPYKYKLTEPGLSEQTLRKQGFLYVLYCVETRDEIAKSVLGYNTSKAETAMVSVTYPADGTSQMKSIPSDTRVFKFYFKHIESGNVFLGTKWDADVTWEEALQNQIRGFKAELKIN